MARHRIPMQENFENSLTTRSLRKPVLDAIPVHEMRDLSRWRVEGIAEISIVPEPCLEQGGSFRFRTRRRDDAIIQQDVDQNGSFSGESGGGTSAVLQFDPPQDWSAYNRLAVWVYLHPMQMRRTALNLQLEPYFRPSLPPYDFISFPRPTFHAQHLQPGQWNLVLWEIADYPREKITGFILSQELFGFEPGSDSLVTYDIGRIELQRVEAEKFEGWEVAPGKIAFNHVGYQPGQEKFALASNLSVSFFQVLDALGGSVVLTRPVQKVVTPQGRFQRMDFSELHRPGSYLLRAGSLLTRPFKIQDDLWTQTIEKALNFYYCERCNYDVPGLHGECHQDLFGIHDGVKKAINGGWHDAADFSQGCAQTGLSIYAMLTLIQQYEDRQLHPAFKEQVIEECLWGLDWFTRSRFGNGHRIAFQTARIYTDNIPGTLDDMIHPARNIPWLNLLGAAVEAFAYEVLSKSRSEMAQDCLRCAVEDWQAAIDVLPEDTLTLSWGVISSIHLYRITRQSKFKEKAVLWGQQLLQCQERTFLEGLSLTGFFYRDISRQVIQHYNHMGFEESPILALAELCTTFPGHAHWMEWYAAVVLHSEYYQKRGAQYTAPFGMLINSIYCTSELDNIADPSVRAGKLKQIREGTHLFGDYYLKRFPVWENELFHGGTGVQLSQALALTLASRLRADNEGEELSRKQLQWVFGGNPFGQTLMYGEGYDYPSLHAHRQADFVGALSVGMDCRGKDEPFWPYSNYATQKEIWVVAVSRFLWNAALVGQPARVEGSLIGSEPRRITFQNRITGKVHRIRVGRNGNFALNLPAGEYRVQAGNYHRILTIMSGEKYELNLDIERFIDLSAKVEGMDEKSGTIQITAELNGKGRHEITLHCYNAQILQPIVSVNLTGDRPIHLRWDLVIEKSHIPWVVVLVPDDEWQGKTELTGSLMPVSNLQTIEGD